MTIPLLFMLLSMPSPKKISVSSDWISRADSKAMSYWLQPCTSPMA